VDGALGTRRLPKPEVTEDREYDDYDADDVEDVGHVCLLSPFNGTRLVNRGLEDFGYGTKVQWQDRNRFDHCLCPASSSH